MIIRPPILAFAPHPWWNHWLSRQQLLSRLGERGWPILYSHGPLSWWQRHSKLWKESDWLGSVVSSDHISIDKPGRLPPLWPKWPAWDERVNRYHTNHLLRYLAKRGDLNHLIAFLFYPTYQPLITHLKPRHVVYHVYDVYSLMEDWSAEKTACESSLIHRADLITVSSLGMAKSLSGVGPTKARVLNNGADSHRFLPISKVFCPEDLAAISRPRIGYVGNINPKLDLEMILSVAKQRRQWQWVFLGPVYMDGLQKRDREAKRLWEQCLLQENIHFLGLRSREQMPSYVQHMDVNTICYKISLSEQGDQEDWVVHGYPTKLHEYLAAGKPVVAAAQEAVKCFSSVARIARTPQEWEMAIEEALSQGGVGTVDQRQRIALENTWDKRVDLLESWLIEMIQR